MIYYDIKIPMPEKGVLFRNHKNGSVYVYYTVKAYRNKAGKPTSKVAAIGKKDLSTGKLIPNTRYYALFPTVCHEAPPIAQPKCSLKPKQVKTIGSTIAFMELARRVNLLATLQTSFPDKWDKILATSFYMLSEGNVMSYISDWFEETKIDFTENLYDVACSRLFESISMEARQQFFQEWIKQRHEPLYISYDVTSISSYAQNIDIVEWGYNRDHDKLPQINFGMFCGITTGLPAYYHIYNGSIPDTACLNFMMQNAKDIGIDKACFVIDGGFMSEDNLNFMVENDYSFISAISAKRIDTMKIIDENIGKINKNKNFIKDYHIFGAKQSFSLYGLALQAHIYFDPHRYAFEFSELTTYLAKLENELKTINKSKNVTKRFTDYYDVKEHSKNSITFTVDDDKVDHKMSRAGYFVLVTNDPNLSCEEVLRIYRDRDIIEKNFDQFKNGLDFKRAKTHYVATTEGKMFTGFIALIIRTQLKNVIKNNTKTKGLTVGKVLKELKKIKSVKMSNGQEILLPLTKIQKTILEVIGVNKALIE